MAVAESELIINGDGSVFHLHMKPDHLADTVILVGDRDRVGMMKKYFTDIESETSNREFVSFTGNYRGVRITCLSTGIGIGNIDIVMNELDALANIDFKTREVKPEHRRLTILRLGTCGAVQGDVPIGSYVFSRYSIGTDGLLGWYGSREVVLEPEIAGAFADHIHRTSCQPMPYVAKSGDRLASLFEDCTISGMTISAPGFYGPQGRSVRVPLALPDMLEKIESFRYEGMRILNFEMEGSAIAALARHLGHEAGTVCCVLANRYHKSMNTDYKSLVDKLIVLVLDRLSSSEQCQTL